MYLPQNTLTILKHARHPLLQVLLHFGGFIFYDVNSDSEWIDILCSVLQFTSARVRTHSRFVLLLHFNKQDFFYQINFQ